MSKRIKNPNYLNFLENGMITILEPRDIDLALDNCNKEARFKKQKRALLIALYLTGARPSEVLELLARDITKKAKYIKVQIRKATKKSNPRIITLKHNNPHAKELLDYASSLPPNVKLFFNMTSLYIRKTVNKKGEAKVYEEKTRKVRYFIYKVFDNVLPHSIPPYFLRHNRFSQLIQEGASETDIRMIKGAKSMDSVTPYIHMSSKISNRMAKLIK